MRALFISLALTACSTSLVHAKVQVAVDSSNPKQPVLTAHLTEQISPGDYTQLRAALNQHPGRFSRKVAWLNNIGGATSEAMRMGRLLNEQGFETAIAKQAVCQGSCIYLLAAGRKRQVEGAVAVHRPAHARGDSFASKSLPLPETDVQYFSYMGISSDLLSLIAQTPPEHPYLLSTSELARYKLILPVSTRSTAKP